MQRNTFVGVVPCTVIACTLCFYPIRNYGTHISEHTYILMHFILPWNFLNTCISEKTTSHEENTKTICVHETYIWRYVHVCVCASSGYIFTVFVQRSVLLFTLLATCLYSYGTPSLYQDIWYFSKILKNETLKHFCQKFSTRCGVFLCSCVSLFNLCLYTSKHLRWKSLS